MSEFSESFNISKLIGSPAGYVGYKDPTSLTDRVKKRPYSVVLFDEIEKAHAHIFNLLLQILEDGHLTDASGKTINFKNTIIIMTSNLGSEAFNQKGALGFDATTGDEKLRAENSFQETKKTVLEQLQKFFRVEFLNRIDMVIVFSPLSKMALEKIVKRELHKLEKKLKEHNVMLRYNAKVVLRLAQMSYAPNLGARAVRKNVLELVENPIAQKLLSENIENEKKISLSVEKKKIVIE